MAAYVPSEAERQIYGTTISTTYFWVAILGSAMLCRDLHQIDDTPR